MSKTKPARPSDWERDYWGPEGTLARGLKEYSEGPWGTSAKPLGAEFRAARVAWTSTLYSALNSTIADRDIHTPARVAWCLWHLRPQMRHFCYVALNSPIVVERFTADQSDVVSTALRFWSHPLLGGASYRPAAKAFALVSYTNSAKDEPWTHTHPLAGLTLARIYLKDGETKKAREVLREVITWAPTIRDPNQRSRVYRGIAELTMLLCAAGPHVGEFWDCRSAARRALTTAEQVPGIGTDVVAKNLAMRKKLYP